MFVIQCDACGKQVAKSGALTWSLYYRNVDQMDERSLDFCSLPCVQAWASARLPEGA
mgnify:FL=1